MRRIASRIAADSFRSCTSARTDPKSLWDTRHSRPAIQAVRPLRQQVRLRLRDDELLQERLLSDGKGDQPDEGHLDDEPRGPEVHPEVREEDLEQQLADGEAGNPEDDEERVPADLFA